MKTVNIKYSDGQDVLNCEAFISGRYIVLISIEELFIIVYDVKNNCIKHMDIEADLDWYGGFKQATEIERINFSKIWHLIIKKLSEN